MRDDPRMAPSVLKQHAPVFAVLLRALDPIVAILTGIAIFAIYVPAAASFENYGLFLIAAALTILAVFPAFQLYAPQRGVSFAEELRGLLFAWIVIAGIAATLLFATKSGAAFSRVWFGAWVVSSFLVTAILRVMMRIALRSLRRRGWNQRHIVVIGAGTLGRVLAERLHAAPWAGFNIVGFYDDDRSKIGSAIAGHLVVDTIDRVVRDVAHGHIDQVWIALPLRSEQRIREILEGLRDHPVEIRFVPDIYGFHMLNHSFTEVAGMPVISLTETPMSGINQLQKLIEDYVLAVLLVVLFSPLLVLIAVGVKLSSPGPVLFRQERVTWNGRRFGMLKFRTMPVSAEADSGPVWSRRGEPRATAFGRVLRRFSLDELPQLFNVLRGEMSLVGPRPERPEFVQQFRREIPGYMQKHLVKAGITGWAQVNDLRGDSDLVERINYDLYYIEHWSLWFDLRILALTLWHILTSRNAH
jgi:putative colanic acid biosynthesis UDP-glucose lipid carrier transferase